MSLFQRTARSYNKGSTAIISLPKEYIGKEVVVVIEDELHELRETIRNAYLLNKMGDFELRQLRKEFDEFKSDLLPRLSFIERSLTSLVPKKE